MGNAQEICNFQSLFHQPLAAIIFPSWYSKIGRRFTSELKKGTVIPKWLVVLLWNAECLQSVYTDRQTRNIQKTSYHPAKDL